MAQQDGLGVETLSAPRRFWIGSALVAVGFYIALFTDLTTKYGLTGMRADVELIALGLFLLIPSRAVMVLKLMKVDPDQTISDESDAPDVER